MKHRRTFALLLVLITAALRAEAGTPISYDRMIVRLKAARATGRVAVVSLGESADRRAIPLVAIGQADAPVRVLVLCRQHGDEPTSTEAAMRVIARAARGDQKLLQALSGTLLLLVPMANPDGAVLGTRENAVGADLNRDWEALSQPETRAIAKAYDRLAPQVLLDEHEWTATDHYGANTLETTLAPDPLSQKIQQGAVRTGNAFGIPLKPLCYSSQQDARLAHRHFGFRGAAAFLLETTSEVKPEARLALYESMIVRVGKMAARDAAPQPAPARVSSFPELASSPAPRRHKPNPAIWLLGVAGFALVLTIMTSRPKHRRQEPSLCRQPSFRRVPLSQVSDLHARLERRRKIVALRPEG